jgi:hypothetical protein
MATHSGAGGGAQRAFNLTEIHRGLRDCCDQNTTFELAIALASWLSCPDRFGVCLQRVTQVTSSPLVITLTAALAGLSATPKRIPLMLQAQLLIPVEGSPALRTQFLQWADQWWQRWTGVASWQDAGPSTVGEHAVIALPWLRSESNDSF